MKKYSVLFAAALLALSTGIASAQTRHHRVPAATGLTGELSSTNVLEAAGPAGYSAPHEVPENGGAASFVQPGYTPN